MVETLKLNPKRSHRKGRSRDKTKAVFLPVDVRGDAVVSPDTLSKSHDGRIEIALVNGLRITLSGNFDPDAVAQLVRGLSA